ncbi:ATPase, T2SS/T4P/T4SS family [Candidatus Uabimicrobium amorphum]|uniref:Type II secretion system protein E n=1 Tax=Uabimicrobium amorphum TaxID=2596890 RepID=A0A5S9IJL3_UABAM|nr:hypothetical protein [Candidatus Uabimicrobium amorphum]BBM82737.1 type II secretion system protein E [Candidatus Uabimicrobium amorphum]
MDIEKIFSKIANTTSDSSVFSCIGELFLLNFRRLYFHSHRGETSISIYDTDNHCITRPCSINFIHNIKKAFDIQESSIQHRFLRQGYRGILHYLQDDNEVSLKLQTIATQTLKPLSQLGMNKASQDIIVQKNTKAILISSPQEGGATTTQSAILNELTTKRCCAIDNGNTQWPKNTDLLAIRHDIGMNIGAIFEKTSMVDYWGIAHPIRDHDSLSAALELSEQNKMLVVSMWGGIHSPLQTIQRVCEMGGSQVIDCVDLIISQYLLPQQCGHCGVGYDVSSAVERELLEYGVDIAKVRLGYNTGCEKCRYIGYNGQVLIYELWQIDAALRKAVHTNMSEEKITKMAQKTATLRETLLHNLYAGKIDAGTFLQVMEWLT